MLFQSNNGIVEISDRYLAKNKIDIYQMRDNIIEIYDAAVPTEHYKVGLNWYREKRELCERIGAEHGVDPKRVAYAIAVTSNNIHWSRQEKISGDFIKWVKEGNRAAEFKRGIIPTFAEKAEPIILHGIFSSCTGPKVEAFARNLCGEEDVVTIDRHAVRIPLKRMTDDNETTSWVRPGPKRLCLEASYHLAAKERDIKVAPLQAITWVYVTEQANFAY